MTLIHCYCIKPVINLATPFTILIFSVLSTASSQLNRLSTFKYLSTASSQLTVTVSTHLKLTQLFTPPPTNDHIINRWYLAEPLTVEDNRASEKQERSTCVSHNAVNMADTKSSHGLAATEVGMINCTRHDMKLPNGVGDLQKGERPTSISVARTSLSTGRGTWAEQMAKPLNGAGPI
ncbi:uncharacterized protein F5147DRAFT_656284 [Suillus discolor]|uniref:Uncharacterized protein n=1 Tax=Suillus discolor TaxID=1912936 RepID=A0A9P7EZS6_9AGAM|nr:uncharacterized protein F5147DRAFT_656284 [Suillus discolor]KAG2097746.1 hypothetical protein F5147DRAFT_656284 [Suillus discolor]